MKKVLITGAFGFAASYLIKLLLEKEIEVHGIIRENSNDFRHQKLNIKNHDNLILHKGDLTDPYGIYHIIDTVRPDIIYNLGAHMYVQTSFEIPKTVFEVNTIGVLNILEAVKSIDKKIRIIQAGTSEEYGYVRPEECPITEENSLRPMSPYGVSKVAAEHLCKIYNDSYDMDIIVTRAFNHAGVYQNPELVIPAFVRRVMEQAFFNKGIIHGNMEAIRDFIHIEDIVEAYYIVGKTKNVESPINICSGKGVSMQEVMDMAINVVSLRFLKYIKYPKFKDAMKQKYFRPNDVLLLEGDNSRIKELGWKQKKSFEQIVINIADWLWEEEFFASVIKTTFRVSKVD